MANSSIIFCQGSRFRNRWVMDTVCWLFHFSKWRVTFLLFVLNESGTEAVAIPLLYSLIKCFFFFFNNLIVFSLENSQWHLVRFASWFICHISFISLNSLYISSGIMHLSWLPQPCSQPDPNTFYTSWCCPTALISPWVCGRDEKCKRQLISFSTTQ